MLNQTGKKNCHVGNNLYAPQPNKGVNRPLFKAPTVAFGSKAVTGDTLAAYGQKWASGKLLQSSGRQKKLTE